MRIVSFWTMEPVALVPSTVADPLDISTACTVPVPESLQRARYPLNAVLAGCLTIGPN